MNDLFTGRPDPMRPLAGRRALVTGASRGIGRAIAVELARRGARVAGVGRTMATLARAMKGLVDARGDAAVPVVADLADPASAVRAVDEATAVLGPLDLIVHAAGTGGFVAADRLTPADWLASRSANLDALVYLFATVVPPMVARGEGDIVAVLSIAAVQTFPGAAPYCATKAGALAFVRCVREEVRRAGVRVSVVLPGSVDTPFWDQFDLGLDRRQMLAAEDVAAAVIAAVTASPRAAIDEIHVLPRAGIL
ncbi:MAG: SDR family oxidoreductase [Chloroflexi bacterium]|nr:SDR family oxidoreductase [Chloroflexota bacterium]